MKNIVVLVSGGGTNLQALIDAEKRGEIRGGKITCVIASKADAYALTRAADNGIKTRVLARRDFPDVKSYSKAMRDALVEENADLVVYAGFMTILDEQVCDAFPNRMINIHPALIPSFCGKGFYGLHVHEAALAKGVKVSGATVHFVTADCDAGPIILQKAVDRDHTQSGTVRQLRLGRLLTLPEDPAKLPLIQFLHQLCICSHARLLSYAEVLSAPITKISL